MYFLTFFCLLLRRPKHCCVLWWSLVWGEGFIVLRGKHHLTRCDFTSEFTSIPVSWCHAVTTAAAGARKKIRHWRWWYSKGVLINIQTHVISCSQKVGVNLVVCWFRVPKKGPLINVKNGILYTSCQNCTLKASTFFAIHFDGTVTFVKSTILVYLHNCTSNKSRMNSASALCIADNAYTHSWVVSKI